MEREKVLTENLVREIIQEETLILMEVFGLSGTKPDAIWARLGLGLRVFQYKFFCGSLNLA